MIIEVKVLSTLRRYVPASERNLGDNMWDIPEGATIADFLEILRIPEEQDKTILINGRSAGGERVLRDGDSVQIFPLIFGG